MSAVLRCLGHRWYPMCADGCCRECLVCGDASAGGHVGTPLPRPARVTGWDARPLRLTRRGESALAWFYVLLFLGCLAVAGRIEGMPS